MDLKLYCKIYELKGLISSLSDISEREEGMDHPIIYRLQEKIDEIVEGIEGGTSSATIPA